MCNGRMGGEAVMHMSTGSMHTLKGRHDQWGDNQWHRKIGEM
jgi:hypothetical protein